MQTRNQKYATIAFRQVQELTEKDERKKYGSMAHKLPVLIRTAGLAQALEFVESRGDNPQKLLLDHLAQAVIGGGRAELLRRSREHELADYVRLTQEALAALLWYKRFAQSVLDVEAGEEGVTAR